MVGLVLHDFLLGLHCVVELADFEAGVAHVFHYFHSEVFELFGDLVQTFFVHFYSCDIFLLFELNIAHVDF